MTLHVSDRGPLGSDAALRRDRTILGVDVRPLGWGEAMDFLAARIRNGRFTRIAFLNAHVANTAATRPEFRAALKDFVVLADGVGVDIASRVLYGRPFPANLNGTDFVPAFLAAQARPLRIGLLGTTPAHVERAASHLRGLAPQHAIVFVEDGFFRPEDEPALLGRLEEARPDVLLVGMGVPRQEMWIASRLDQRHCTVALGIGALLDFLSGAVPRAPGWMRSLRLEWLFRLAIEPGRLWRRYVVGNPLFLWRLLRQKIGGGGAA